MTNMPDKKKKEESYEVVDASGKTHVKLDVFLRAIQQRLMGIALDNGRMSINTDRQFVQFEKSTKDKFYQITEDAINFLRSRGIVSHADKPSELG
jgi:hypothetical protein